MRATRNSAESFTPSAYTAGVPSCTPSTYSRPVVPSCVAVILWGAPSHTFVVPVTDRPVAPSPKLNSATLAAVMPMRPPSSPPLLRLPAIILAVPVVLVFTQPIRVIVAGLRAAA